MYQLTPSDFEAIRILFLISPTNGAPRNLPSVAQVIGKGFAKANYETYMSNTKGFLKAWCNRQARKVLDSIRDMDGWHMALIALPPSDGTYLTYCREHNVVRTVSFSNGDWKQPVTYWYKAA